MTLNTRWPLAIALVAALGGFVACSQSDGPRPESAPASPTTGAPGVTSAPAATGDPGASSPDGGLTVGEYACYGSGGQILAGFGFTALDDGRYTDLEGTNPGSYSVDGETVTFRGGHLDGTVGRALDGGNFRIGAQATCEPF